MIGGDVYNMDKKEIEYRLRWIAIIVSWVILLALIIYVVSHVGALKADPCSVCQNVTGKICLMVQYV